MRLLTIIALTRASVVDILSRDAPQGELLVAFPIATDDGRQLGDLEFYEKDAAVDTVAAYCSQNELPSWFRKMLAAKVCERTLEADKSLLEKLPVCWRTRALYYEESIQAPDKDRSYPGKLEVWEDEDPTKAVEYFLLQAEKEILKNRTTWDAQHERWEKNRTKNVELVVETEHIARRRSERDKALKQISELDWLLDNHTLSEPMRVPNGWFRKALVDHVCSLPGLSCEGRRKSLPELPITVDGSDKPRGVVRMFEGVERCRNHSRRGDGVSSAVYAIDATRVTHRRRGRRRGLLLREAARAVVQRVSREFTGVSVYAGGCLLYSQQSSGVLSVSGGHPGRAGDGLLAEF